MYVITLIINSLPTKLSYLIVYSLKPEMHVCDHFNYKLITN